jgi:hypothetical protein
MEGFLIIRILKLWLELFGDFFPTKQQKIA